MTTKTTRRPITPNMPVSVRLSRSDRRRLRVCAAKRDISMSRYIREQLLEALRRDDPEGG